jgi:glutamate/aspartate transport system substrate-binding protein
MKNRVMNKLRQIKYHIRSSATLLAALLAFANPAAAQAPAASDGMGPTLGKIASTGNLFAAHREDSVPFSYVAGGEQGAAIHGYSWEICGHVAKAVEQRLGREIKVVPVNVSANSRIMMVKVGMADLECGATTNNVARQKQVAFSNTIYVAEVRLMVRKNSGIKRIADLANKHVVTTMGSTADRLIKQAALANNITIQHLMGRTHAESMDMVVRGEADAYVGDDAILAGMRANSSLKDELVFLPESLSTEPYGIMLQRDDAAFKSLVDEAIVGLMKSGEFEQIYNKWFMNPIPPKGVNLQMPMSEKLKAVIANPNDKPAY